jgi:hypothetical protein
LSTLQSQAEALLAQAGRAPAHSADLTPKYDRLKYADIGKILRLHDEGLPQTVIAEQVGCHQSTISRVLSELGDDTSELAVRRLKVSALKAANRVVDITENSPHSDEALKAAKVVLAASGVTERDKAFTTQPMVVVVGVTLTAPERL